MIIWKLVNVSLNHIAEYSQSWWHCQFKFGSSQIIPVMSSTGGTTGSRQLLCWTNKLQPRLGCESRLPFDAFRLPYEPPDHKECNSLSFVHQLTKRRQWRRTDVFQKPVASHHAAIRLIFADSLHPACSRQWGRVPLEAACDRIMLGKWNEGVEWIWLEGDGWINGRDVGGLLSLFSLSFIPLSVFLSFFLFSLNLILGNLVHLYSFLSFFRSPPPPSFQLSVLSDYCGDGPVKASPIIVFEQHCSLALCSSETRLFSICSLYRSNTGQLCLFSSDRTFITCNSPLCQAYYRSQLLATSQDIFLGDSCPHSWFIRLKLLKCKNDSEIVVLVDVSIDMTVMSLQPIKKILNQHPPRRTFKTGFFLPLA